MRNLYLCSLDALLQLENCKYLLVHTFDRRADLITCIGCVDNGKYRMDYVLIAVNDNALLTALRLACKCCISANRVMMSFEVNAVIHQWESYA